MRRKTATMEHHKSIFYDNDRWELLKNIRKKAVCVMYALRDAGLGSFIHGSAARGDVSSNSDIDIVIPDTVQSYRVELALDTLGITGRKLIQATPNSLIKAHIHLPFNTMVTFPLTQPTNRELDFYAFGGLLGLNDLEDIKNRVPGVDKRLMLIEPTEEGHEETPLSDLSSGVVAKKVGVGQDIVEERIRVLSRRAKVGITGIYIDRTLAPDEGFEAVLEDIASTDSLVRRRVKTR